MDVEVKICGLTREVDLESAVRAGASFLGMVLDHGPRMVSESRASELVAAAAGVPVVAVVTATPVEGILALRDRAGFSVVQLHGDYRVADCARLVEQGLDVWRVVRLGSRDELDLLAENWPGASATLVEPQVARVAGGAGVPLDPELARAARESIAGRMVLAGGLRPDTVVCAVAGARPEVVDVSSGVESGPGIKDPTALRRFMEVLGVPPRQT